MTGKLSIGTAWSDAAALLRRERRVLAPVVLGLVLLPAVISTMVTPPTPPGESPEPGAWMLIALAMILIMLVGQMTIVLIADGWRGSIGEAIGRALRRAPALILAVLTLAVPFVLIFSVLLAIVETASGGGGPLAPDNLSGPGAAVMLLMIAAGLLIAIRLMPLVAVIAEGSEGPIASLKRCWALTRGTFWKLLAFALLTGIALLVVSGAAGAVVGSIAVIALGQPEPWSVTLLLMALAAGLIQAAVVTVYTAMLARIRGQLEGSSSAT